MTYKMTQALETTYAEKILAMCAYKQAERKYVYGKRNEMENSKPEKKNCMEWNE
jgi:hypothetical protein